jgi:hypothetical protein
MSARIVRRSLTLPLQLCANEHGLIMLNVKRRPSRPPTELPPGATPTQVIKAQFERFIDYLFEV